MNTNDYIYVGEDITNKVEYRMPNLWPHSRFRLVHGVLHEAENPALLVGPVRYEHLDEEARIELHQIAKMLAAAP